MNHGNMSLDSPTSDELLELLEPAHFPELESLGEPSITYASESDQEMFTETATDSAPQKTERKLRPYSALTSREQKRRRQG